MEQARGNGGSLRTGKKEGQQDWRAALMTHMRFVVMNSM